jgi:hypothetical protein
LTDVTIWVGLEDIINEISTTHRKINIISFHLHEAPRRVNLIETEDWILIPRESLKWDGDLVFKGNCLCLRT